jgi:hypothetical protein
MTNFYTAILVKNIPAATIEQILRQKIAVQNFLKEEEQIVIQLKNSRTLVLNFSNGISKLGFDIIVNALLLEQANTISKPELVAIYCGEIIYSVTEKDIFDTTDAAIVHYKLKQGPLHQITILNVLNCKPKKWWQFWK